MPQNHLFSTTSELNGNFNGLHLPNETRHRESDKCIDNYKESPTSSQNVMNFGHKRFKTRPAFLSTVRKFSFLLHCQTEISKRKSTKLCQAVNSKSRKQSAVDKSRSFLPKKLGPKNFYICSVFRRLRYLMANIF